MAADSADDTGQRLTVEHREHEPVGTIFQAAAGIANQPASAAV